MAQYSKKLSDNIVKTAKPREKTYRIWDIQQPGFCLEVSSKGKCSWKVKYRIGKGALGKQKLVTLEDPRYLPCDEARAKAAELYFEGRKGIDVAQLWKAQVQEQIKASVTRALDEDYGVADLENPIFLKTAWFNTISLKPPITQRYERNLERLWKHIAERYGDNIKTVDMTAEKINKIRKDLQDRPAEFNNFRNILYSTMNNEVEEGRLAKNPVKRVSRNVAKYREVFLSRKGIKQFTVFYSNYKNVKPHQVNIARFFLCLLMTGQRPTMLRELQKEDNGHNNFVDFDKHCLVFRNHKTDKKSQEQATVVPVSEKVIAIMSEAKNVSEGNRYVFASHDMRKKFNELPISERRSQEIFKKNAHRFETEGYGKFVMYCLRHTFGTHLTDQGIPITVVSRMMLHSNILTTQRYAKATDQGKQEAVNIIKKMMQIPSKL